MIMVAFKLDCLWCKHCKGIVLGRFQAWIECERGCTNCFQITSKKLYQTLNLARCKHEVKEQKVLFDFAR